MNMDPRLALRFKELPVWGFLFILSLSVVTVGCGSYSNTTRKARDEYYSGHFSDAAKSLEKGSQEESVDQLLYILDRGTALHNAGDYEQAIKEFRRADKLAEIVDYTSLSKEAATLVTNDKIIQYKGEDFEKVLINQYLAIDYLMMGMFEDALVESRRVNRKLYLMITEGKRKYKLNPMAKYLSAIIYEASGQYNDAYIDYKSVYELAPDFPYLKQDLYRTAWKSGLDDAMEKLTREYSLTSAEKEEIRKNAARNEVIVLVENGKSPEKQPHPNWQALPKYYPRSNAVDYVEVAVEGKPLGRSFQLFDIEQTAIHDLDDKFAGLLAKRIAGVAAKEVIAYQVEDKVNPLLGAVLRIGMHVADQADTRSWLTLPKSFQIFRAPLDSDQLVHIKIAPRGAGGEAVEVHQEKEKVVETAKKAPKKVFIPVRIL